METDPGHVCIGIDGAGGKAHKEGSTFVVEAVASHVHEVFNGGFKLTRAGNDLDDVGHAVTIGLELTFVELFLPVSQILEEDALALLFATAMQVDVHVKHHVVRIAVDDLLHVDCFLLFLEVGYSCD